jgi:hypothetical protein
VAIVKGKDILTAVTNAITVGGGVLFVALSATGQDIINNKPAPACLISNLSFSLPKVQYKPGQGVTGYDTPEYEQVLTQRQGKV